MKWKDFEELVELRNEFMAKMNVVNQLLPGGIPVAPEVELTPGQRKAVKDADAAWEKFRQKVRALGGLVD